MIEIEAHEKIMLTTMTVALDMLDGYDLMHALIDSGIRTYYAKPKRDRSVLKQCEKLKKHIDNIHAFQTTIINMLQSNTLATQEDLVDVRDLHSMNEMDDILVKTMFMLYGCDMYVCNNIPYFNGLRHTLVS